jgi:hypothetical protein
MIDKVSEEFSPATLRHWKSLHEDRISQAMDVPPFDSAIELYRYVCRLLGENGIVHQRYGPTSLAARHDIFGEAADVWKFRKLSTIVPNNSRIIRAFVANQRMVPDEVWRSFLEFQEHARGFEANCYHRLDGHLVPRFPESFGILLKETIKPSTEEKSKCNRAVRLFESRLCKHKSVASFTKPDQIYVLRLIDGREIRVFLAVEDTLISIVGYPDYLEAKEEEAASDPTLTYTIGQAYVVEILDCLGLDANIDCIVSLSAYSWYTEQAQAVAEEFEVKLFTVKELFKFLGTETK